MMLLCSLHLSSSIPHGKTTSIIQSIQLNALNACQLTISDEPVGHDDNIYNIDDVDEDDDIMGDTISSKLSLVATIFGCIYDLCALPNLPYLKNFVFLYFAYLHF